MPTRPYIDKRRIVRTQRGRINDGWKLRDQVRSVLNNGVGRYIPQLSRLTICFCPEYANSANVRHIITNDLSDFARKNPATAIYVQPRRHTAPYMRAEYLNGREVSAFLGLHSIEETKQWIDYFLTRSGRRIAYWTRDIHTQHPSIQGVWEPWQDVDGDRQRKINELRHLLTSIPRNVDHNDDIRLPAMAFRPAKKSATEVVREMMENVKVGEKK